MFTNLTKVLLILEGISLAVSDVIITSPKQITAFSSDVTITVSGAADGELIEVFYDQEASPLTGQIVTRFNDQMNDDVTLVFDCGYFSRLGDYKFVLRNLSGRKNSPAASAISTATEWPRIDISMKPSHEAFTTDVKVTIASPPDICHSDVANRYEAQVIVLRDDAVVMETYDVSFPPTSIVCECDVFAKPGNYVTQLRVTSVMTDVVIGESDVMRVDWSGEYFLKVPEVIFPCTERRLKIPLERPPCAPQDDVIQAVAMFHDGSSHVITNVTVGNSDEVSFLCPKLHEFESPAICFRYVTSQAIVRTACRSRDADFSLDGDWSIWSYWNTCNRKCVPPIRQRVRSCDNPKPIGEGGPCSKSSNSSIQFEIETQKSNVVDSRCPVDVSDTSPMTSQCSCGCMVSAIDKGIFTSPISGECNGKRELVWTFYTSLDHVIRFRVLDLQLKYDESLFVSDHAGTSSVTSDLQLVTSLHNVVSLTYVRSPLRHNLDSCGFVLTFESIERSSLPTTAPSGMSGNYTISPQGGDSWMDDVVRNPVLAIAVSICVVIIIIVVVIAVVKCRRHRVKGHKFNGNLPLSLENRLIAPPDGKSSSNIDTESDRPTPIGENSRHDDVMMTPKPRAAYYLAQRQLQLMKKEGRDNSSQVYASTCINDQAICDQESLLFGPSVNQSDSST